MPEISRFFGLVIRMFYLDHEPPHFHVAYSGVEAVIRIEPICLLKGNLPPRVFSLAVEWASGLKTKFGVQSPVGASQLTSLEILAIPLVLLWFPPCDLGTPPGFVLPQLHSQSTNLHQGELLENCLRLRADELPLKIAPLE